MKIYEVALRNEDGKLVKITEFNNDQYIESYLNKLKNANLEKSEIVILEKTYECISTIPYLLNRE